MPTIPEKHREIAVRFDRWLGVLNYSYITRDHYARTIRDFLKSLKNKFVLRSDQVDVQEFLAAEAAKGVSPRTVVGHLYALRILFDFLCLGGLMRWSPARVVHSRRMRAEIPHSLTLSQVCRLFRSARSPRERALLEVLYGTGCRTGEIQNMLVEDIDFENSRIRVRGKTGRRVVLFSKETGVALRRYIGARRKGYAFTSARSMQSFRPNPSPCSVGAWTCQWKKYEPGSRKFTRGFAYISGRKKKSYEEAWAHFAKLASRDNPQRSIGDRPLSAAAIQKTIKKVAMRAGIDVRPGLLRHTFATHLLENGADVRVVQDLMGHANIRSTEHYTHVSKNLVKGSFEKFSPRKRLGQVLRKPR